MGNLNSFKYTKEHEWVMIDKEVATIGITDFAQNQLGDIVFIELPEESSEIEKNEPFGAIEAVKTVADLFAPISGNIIDINKELEDNPDLVNTSPYALGWIIKTSIKNHDELNDLMNLDEYENFIKEN
ncbi:MAG: glycine cleavage system protein H [Candidatus Marinimicrobia bacterium]|nr:glycine cleavage system protein H [Candidatus Neomarinimicrobiota bacterium]